MNVTRQAVKTALLALITPTLQAQGFVTISPRIVSWEDCPKTQQPAAYLVKDAEDTARIQDVYGLNRYSLPYRLWVYMQRNADPTQDPEAQFNSLLDAVDNAVNPQVGRPQTLAAQNGNKPMVDDVWIEGRTLIDPGVFDQQVVLVIPIRVVTGS